MVDPDGSVRQPDKYDAPLLLAGKEQHSFHVMAKPIGPSCNLDCTYCYYLAKADLADGSRSGKMSDEVLERFIRKYIQSVTAKEVVFSWQGGEPTLLGIGFFQRVVELQKKYAKPHQAIQNDLQTNGTLLDDEWCRFLRDNRFLVGLSIDGPREIHDHFRFGKKGQPSFEKVLNAAHLLHRHGVPFNTLTCIHRDNARRPLDIYRFLRRDIGSTNIQFIPIVEHRDFRSVAPQTWRTDSLPRQGEPAAQPGSPDSVVTDWSVAPDDWGYFLCKVFDEWANKDLGKVFVNHFETLVAQHLGLASQMCVYAETCGKGLAIEHDGTIFSCDHYVYPEYRIGKIDEGELRDTALSRAQVKFGYAKSETLPRQCRECDYLSDCWGECPKNRVIRTADGEPELNYLCSGLKKFFGHAIPRVERIVAEIRKHGVRPQPRM
ncbi:radical SAM protein [Sulfuritalea hydrogenivorans sk43H]|uniref:Radical SAM protein n=1 Tax=Sulfuritalea hydrogenivorans sk43H TaxID=1223802 RepID=W0SBF8_9PROT|nr:radical SAM protein [Sulfuritalea hydrogenivorans sk43H]